MCRQITKLLTDLFEIYNIERLRPIHFVFSFRYKLNRHNSRTRKCRFKKHMRYKRTVQTKIIQQTKNYNYCTGRNRFTTAV